MGQINLNEIKSLSYQRAEVNKGYTDKSLKIDLGSNDILIDSIKEEIKEKFIMSYFFSK